MIIIENVVLPSDEQWDAIIRGMRNPKNSWHKTDSDYRKVLSKQCDECEKCYLPAEDSCETCELNEIDIDMNNYIVGPNDLKLTNQLANGGPVHAKYRRMITVYMDITAPLYWWKEFDTYKVGTVANSCSTMHKIQEKEFTLDDFSCEHLIDNQPVPGRVFSPKVSLEVTIGILNAYRDLFNNAKQGENETDEEFKERKKLYWWQMIQLLPSSYNQKRTVMLNYEVLVGIYKWRKDHKLDEWREFCKFIETLPYSELITGKKLEN